MFSFGFGNFLEDGYTATGWLLVGLIQIAIMLAVIGPLQRLRPHVADQDVAALGEAMHHLQRAGALQVQHDGALAAVGVQEDVAHAGIAHGPDVPHVVAFWRLHLGDFGPQFHRHQWPFRPIGEDVDAGRLETPCLQRLVEGTDQVVQAEWLLNEGVRAYNTPSGPCVVFGDFVKAVDLPIKVDLAQRKASGWAIKETNQISIFMVQIAVTITVSLLASWLVARKATSPQGFGTPSATGGR